MAEFSRRHVLAGVSGLVVTPSVLASQPRPASPPKQIDIAVIGAGVSGCYAAWRLANNMPDKKIEVFEFSDRIGGRLWSVRPTGMTQQVAELGGMRIASYQEPLLKLAERLQLTLDPYPATLPEDFYYLRGIRSRAKNLVASTAYGYKVDKKIEGMSVDEIVEYVTKISTGRVDWTQKSFRAAQANLTYKNQPLYKLPHRLVVAEIIGYGGLQFLEDTLGYGFSNIAMDEYVGLLALGLTAGGYKHVREGYDQIPIRLAGHAKEKGARFEFEQELIDIGLEGDSSLLTFATKAGATKQVIANKTIITIPDSAYEKFPANNPLRTSVPVKALLSGLTKIPVVKVYANFPDQWWQDLGISTGGRSITDLPIRQCFYLPDPTGRGLTLSPYASGYANENYFAPLLPDEKYRLVGNSFASSSIVKQLETAHGISIPVPSELIYRKFDGGHTGYGWAMWNPGVNGAFAALKARVPIPGHDLFLCGQSTAIEQGWVMDSLSSVEWVMQKQFGLKKPSWWSSTY